MNVDEIIAKACDSTDLTDLGDAAALDRLERLVKASHEEARRGRSA